MSYKAFAALKEHVELETIKQMPPEQINKLLNDQHEKIKLMESLFKDVATEFYRDWHNSPGTNTDQGFEDWWKRNSTRFLPSS